MKLNNICIFCGSKKGKIPDYEAAANRTVELFLNRNIGLVYGGGSIGIMGVLARGIMNGGGRVTGVIPKDIQSKEIKKDDITELHVVNSMHERKMLMFKKSDGFMILPGGCGTMEEFFEVFTWAQLGFHEKPIGILNAAGFYNELLTFFDKLFNEGFIAGKYKAMLLVAETPEELLTLMENYTPPEVDTWLKDESDV